MAKPPKNPKPTGPVRASRKQGPPKRSGNPTRGSRIFGNTHNCSVPNKPKTSK